MANPPPSEPTNTSDQYWTSLGTQYEAAFANDTGFLALIQKYLTMLPPTATILDCGCGTGKPVATAIASSGRNIHGIDWSAGMISLCRKAVPSGTFNVCNMLEYAPSIEYDGVVASLSIFELSRQEVTTMAQRWHQWMKPGAFLLINTFPADGSPQLKAENYDADGECATNVEWVFMGQIVKITLFTRAGWKVLLEDAGFEIVHTEEDRYEVPAELGKCDPEPRFYIIAKKLSST